MVPVSTVCERLNFVVYDMNGTRVKQVNQTLDAADYGTASFQLPEGDYMVVVVGHSSNGNPTMTNPYKIQFTNTQGFTDTFLCCGDVTIGEEGAELEVSLDRIVSMCQFIITDEIPTEVKKMRFYYTGGSGAFDATTGLGCVNSKQDVKFDVVAGQNEFDLYTFLHDIDGTIHLTVTALDATGNELYNRTFDVPMEQNQITKHAGAFFNGSGSSSTTISDVMVNADWAGEKLITF
ncbi:MAG: FimB/Mfa2 family fimbrial subunit [Bacteroidaceae bacterium]|nr:FimB/Mfa2 family fimbrial subunit [Bacteroidaceae bacterium]